MRTIKTYQSINGALGMYQDGEQYLVSWRWNPKIGYGGSATTFSRECAEDVYEEIRKGMAESYEVTA